MTLRKKLFVQPDKSVTMSVQGNNEFWRKLSKKKSVLINFQNYPL